MKKHIFICSTPFHIINTINLVINKYKNDYKVLYLLDHSDNIYDIYLKLKDLALFNEIYILNVKSFNHKNIRKKKLLKHINKIIEYMFYKSFSKKFIKNKNIVYDYFWISFLDPSSWIMFMFYKRINENIKLNVISDGVGGYNLLATKQNHINKKILNFLGFNSFFDEINEFYINKKELISQKNLYPHIIVKNIPSINDNVKDVLKRIFKISDEEKKILKYDFIYFESPYIQKEIIEKQLQICENFQTILKNKLCVKKHPRSNILKSCDNYINSSIPFEILGIEENLSEKVLISGFSGSSIMPKLLFDQEPYIIFLYKLLDLDKYTYKSENYINFLQKFASIYKNKTKVLIPETEEELKLILYELRKEKR